jgi:hypothetical protein
MNKLLEESIAIEYGVFSNADVAAPLSPVEPDEPVALQAYVVIIPVLLVIFRMLLPPLSATYIFPLESN